MIELQEGIVEFAEEFAEAAAEALVSEREHAVVARSGFLRAVLREEVRGSDTVVAYVEPVNGELSWEADLSIQNGKIVVETEP